MPYYVATFGINYVPGEILSFSVIQVSTIIDYS